MNNMTIFIFVLIAGGALASCGMIHHITMEMDKPKPKPRHPEAPEPGEQVMYVDVSQMNAEHLR